MSVRTVSTIIDRVLREWLEPADDQPVRTRLASDVTAETDSISYLNLMLTPEEEELLGVGTIIEIDLEEIQIGGINEDAGIFTDCIRGINGTRARTHKANNVITIQPIWRRSVIFDAVSDCIVNLYPELYQVRSERGDLSARYNLPPDTDSIIAVTSFNGSEVLHHPYQFISMGTERFILLSDRARAAYTIVFRRGFDRPEYQSTTLSELGINPSWERLLTIGSVAYMVGNRDLDKATEENISDAIANQSFPANSGARVREGLITYYEYLKAQERDRLLVQNSISHRGW